jgi:peptide/nickel transport system permease protein
LPATYQLALAGMLCGLAIAVPLGTLAAYRRGSWIDSVCTMLAVAGQAIPIYWLGLMLMIVFAVQLRWLPASGYGEPANFVLPTVALGSFLAPITMRLVRSSMIDVLSQDYVRTARTKGLAESVVLLRHAFKNAALPVVSVLGLQFGQLLGGAIVTETVFAWPGVASFTVESISNADYPVVQAAVILLALAISLVNLAVDLALGLLDPRIQTS